MAKLPSHISHTRLGILCSTPNSVLFFIQRNVGEQRNSIVSCQGARVIDMITLVSHFEFKLILESSCDKHFQKLFNVTCQYVLVQWLAHY